MVKILPVAKEITRYVRAHRLENKFQKQIGLLSKDFRHPSLNVERLNPNVRGIYSFRIDRKYRGYFTFISDESAIEVLDVNNHYK